MTRMTRQHLPLLLLAGLAAPALAAGTASGGNPGDGYTRVYHRCMEAAGGVTSAMLECIDKETQVQDARLNRAYRLAQQALGAEQQSPLREAQRQWLKYRDANCGLYGHLTGGSIDRVNGASCVLEMTRERADDLHGLAEFGN